MEMNRNQLQDILAEYATLIVLEDDLYDAIDLVYELLCAEAEATKANCPYAHNAIDRLEAAAHEVHELGYDISDLNLKEG